MTELQTFVHSPLAKALAWTLVHSLWQGLAIGAILYAALSGLRDSRNRYAASCLGLLAAVASFGITLTKLLPARLAGAGTVPLQISAVPVSAGGLDLPLVPETLPLLAWLAPVWIVGVLGYYAFSTVSWLAARQLLRRGVCQPDPRWMARLAELQVSLGVTGPVRLLESALVQTPAVLGWLRPVILFPVGLMTALPTGQIEAILLHELAHIRRHDYLVNLLQALAEGLFFYHPAVWWISSAVRTERENCCDDLVIGARGDRLEYARALATLEQSRWPVNTVPAATGGNLMQRISRLLNPTQKSRTLSPALPAAILALSTALTVLAWQTRPAPSLAPPPPQPQVFVAQNQVPPPAPPAPAAPTAPAQRPSRAIPPPPPPPPAPPSPPDAPDAPLSRWVNEDVAYIIRADERARYVGLKTDKEREQFIGQFWERRDPTPGTAANEMKEEHYRRIANANQKYRAASGTPGWRTDRGRIYITYGPPDELESHPVVGNKPAYDAWRYKVIPGVGKDVIMEFVDDTGSGDYRMSLDPNGPKK